MSRNATALSAQNQNFAAVSEIPKGWIFPLRVPVSSLAPRLRHGWQMPGCTIGNHDFWLGIE
jgi:hypothetical protein